LEINGFREVLRTGFTLYAVSIEDTIVTLRLLAYVLTRDFAGFSVLLTSLLLNHLWMMLLCCIYIFFHP